MQLLLLSLLLSFFTDDRGVRDGERKAALMHFDTDQVYKL